MKKNKYKEASLESLKITLGLFCFWVLLYVLTKILLVNLLLGTVASFVTIFLGITFAIIKIKEEV